MAYGGYGQADPYSDYMSGGTYGGGSAPAPGQGMSVDEMLGIGSLGLKAVGTLTQGIGAVQAYKQQEAMRREELRRYQEQQRIAADDRRKRDEQQKRENEIRYGGYARDGMDRRLQEYAGWAARVGL